MPVKQKNYFKYKCKKLFFTKLQNNFKFKNGLFKLRIIHFLGEFSLKCIINLKFLLLLKIIIALK